MISHKVILIETLRLLVIAWTEKLTKAKTEKELYELQQIIGKINSLIHELTKEES